MMLVLQEPTMFGGWGVMFRQIRKYYNLWWPYYNIFIISN